MLAEWLTHLTTPCPSRFRRMGYLREAVALAARERRCRNDWGAHRESCKATMRETMDLCSGRVRAVVMGAGLLNELPLADLSAKFDEVVLIDVVQLRAARKKAEAYGNIRFHREDVTGLLAAVEKGRPLPRPRVQGPALAENADFVASVGLMLQLPLLPIEYAQTGVPEAEAFAHDLIAAHLDWLRRLSAPVCLITDTERLFCRDGLRIGCEDALAGVAPPELAREWMWDIAPAPEALANVDLRFRVRGGMLQGA